MVNWIVGGLLAAAVVWAIVKMRRDRKQGKGCCGGDCSRCAGCAGTKHPTGKPR